MRERRPTGHSGHISPTIAHAGPRRGHAGRGRGHAGRGPAHAGRGRATRPLLAAVGLAAVLLLAGCGSGRPPITTPSTLAAGASNGAGSPVARTSGGVVVTVPGLTSGGNGGASAAGGPSDAATGTITVTATAHPRSSAGTSGTRTAAPSSGAGGASSAPPPAGSTSSAAAPSTTAAPRSVTVDLSTCAGCTVIATHAGVTGDLSAALARTARGAVLLSVRPGGGIAGVINVPYGASFPAPSGAVLPCDRSGRCIVTGRQSNGNAILSAFALGSDGAWRDVSGTDAFPSATAIGVAQDINGDGLLDIAIQDSAGGLTTWMVLTWSGGRFTVLGCAPASGSVPQAGALSPDSCLS